MPSSSPHRKSILWSPSSMCGVRTFLALVAAGIVASAPASRAQPARLASARVAEGLLSGAGAADPGVTVFKGVPFAAPPVGDRRWRAPQPAAAWQGVRKADAFAA